MHTIITEGYDGDAPITKFYDDIIADMMMSTLMVTFNICCKIVVGWFRCPKSMVVLTFVIVRSGGICDDGAGNYDSVDDGVREGIN